MIMKPVITVKKALFIPLYKNKAEVIMVWIQGTVVKAPSL